MAKILNYYGTELLESIRCTYSGRMKLAEEHGFNASESRYFWLYDELQYRLLFLRRTMLYIDALPAFIKKESEEEAVGYVVRFTTAFFNQENCGNAEIVDGRHPFFNDDNSYYGDFTEALNHLDMDYDFSNHPALYIDLTECVVRAARLHLQIRERQYHAIDRDNFDVLMQMRERLPATA